MNDPLQHLESNSDSDKKEECKAKEEYKPVMKKQENYEKQEKQENILDDPLNRFRELRPDLINIRLKQLEYDKKRLAYAAMISKNEAMHYRDRIQKLRRKIIAKQEMIDKWTSYNQKLEDVMRDIQIRLSTFLEVEQVIGESLKAKAELVITLSSDDSGNERMQELDINFESFNPETSKIEAFLQDFQSKDLVKARNSKKIKLESQLTNNDTNATQVPDETKLNDKESSYSAHNMEQVCPYQKGIWSQKERAKYQQFVEDNKDIMNVAELCYKVRIFRQMSNYIGTRSVKQCRSFHRQFIRGKRPQGVV